mgnify:FL=1
MINALDLCFDELLQQEIQHIAMVCSRCSIEIIEDDDVTDENQNLEPEILIKECLLDGTKVFSCTFKDCLFSSNSKRRIIKHQALHQQTFNCGACGKMMGNFELYSEHVLHHNKAKEKNYSW